MSYEGTVVLNYRLTRKLGEGGFGTVYLAEHTDLGRKAACKILHREFASKPDVVDRFFREAKAVCAIGHRAIIDIENFGALPSGEPFYLMEYFPGASLAEHTEHAPLQPAQLVTVFDAVASALAAAHGKQIIHRDLKPENIMVLANEQGAIADVKLLDFGIAKLVGDRDSVRSRSGMSMGTPSFMSPEQALDAKSVDARTDVYSFAATIYAAIAGQPPFSGESVAVLLKVQTDPATPLATYVPSVTAELAAAIDRCLAKQPDNRPATIGDAWREIRAALVGAVDFERVGGAASNVAPTLPPDSPTVYPGTVDLRGGASAAPATVGPPPAAARPAATAAARPPATTLGAAAGESLPLPAGRSRRTLAIAIGASLAVVTVVVIVAVRGMRSPAPASAPVATAQQDARVEPPAIDAPVVVAEPTPDAAVVADAAVAVAAVDAGTKHDRPRPKPPVPQPGSGSNPPPPPPPPPSLACTATSFAAVYTKPAPTEDEVRAALDRLNKCRGQLSPDSFGQIQKNLVSKL